MSEGAFGGVGDATSGQPTPNAGMPQTVARGGYQPPAQYLDVDGRRWTADEIRNGALMHDDYTRKTQGVAQQRAELEQRQQYVDAASQLIAALQQDPTSALLQLAEATGVDLREALTGQGGSSQGLGDQGGDLGGSEDIDWNSPLGQRLAEMEARLEQVTGSADALESQQAEQWLDQETAAVQPLFQALGVPWNEDQVFQYAVEREIPDVDAAAKAFLFDQLIAGTQGGAAPQGGPQAGVGGPGGYDAYGQPLPQSQAAPMLPPQVRQLMAAQTPRGGLQSGGAPAVPQPEPSSFADAIRQTLAELQVAEGELRPD